jgi:hypothetical protein
MASREGNVILAPGFSRGTEVKPKEILYSMSGLLQKGVTLKPNLGVLEAGTPLQYDSASKKYVVATAPANVVGFLRIASDTADPQKLGNIVLGGVVRLSAIPVVAGVTDGTVTAGVPANMAAMATALGGVINVQHGYIKF